jgi:hypothetical protein
MLLNTFSLRRLVFCTEGFGDFPPSQRRRALLQEDDALSKQGLDFFFEGLL